MERGPTKIAGSAPRPTDAVAGCPPAGAGDRSPVGRHDPGAEGRGCGRAIRALERYKVLLDLLTLLAVIAYVAVNAMQWETLTRATEIQENTFAANINDFRIDERAWLEVKLIEPLQNRPLPESPGLVLANAGKTAALGICAKASAADADPAARLPLLLAKVSCQRLPAVLDPGQAVVMGIGGDAHARRQRYIFGAVRYVDDFGIRHFRSFCLEAPVAGTHLPPSPCPGGGNSEDQTHWEFPAPPSGLGAHVSDIGGAAAKDPRTPAPGVSAATREAVGELERPRVAFGASNADAVSGSRSG